VDPDSRVAGHLRLHHKAFHYLHEHGFGSEADSILGPRALALLMIGMGLSAQ
jgi:hypothetical protein